MQLIAINKMASYCSFTAIEHAGAREYRGTDLILIGCFGKNQSIKKVGGRLFKEDLSQALFFFRHSSQNFIYQAKRKRT